MIRLRSKDGHELDAYLARPVGAVKGALVVALLAVAIALQTLQQSEAFSSSGRQVTARRLLPPAFRLAPLRDEGAFFGEIAKLRTRIDGERSQAKADESGR